MDSSSSMATSRRRKFLGLLGSTVESKRGLSGAEGWKGRVGVDEVGEEGRVKDTRLKDRFTRSTIERRVSVMVVGKGRGCWECEQW